MMDEVVSEITNNKFDLVDYHKDFFLELGNETEQGLKDLEKDAEFMRTYDKEYTLLSKDQLAKYPGFNYGYNLPIKILNTAKFCQLSKEFGIISI